MVAPAPPKSAEADIVGFGERRREHKLADGMGGGTALCNFHQGGVLRARGLG